jgi:hypothetical protein
MREVSKNSMIKLDCIFNTKRRNMNLKESSLLSKDTQGKRNQRYLNRNNNFNLLDNSTIETLANEFSILLRKRLKIFRLKTNTQDSIQYLWLGNSISKRKLSLRSI